MATMVEKKVNFFGNDVQIRIPSRMDFLVSDEDYFDSFELGKNLVLHVHVKKVGNKKLPYISTGVHTKDGVAISKYDTNLMPKDELYGKLLSEIDGTVANIRRDVSISYNKAIKLTESLNSAYLHVLNEESRKRKSQFSVS